MRMFVGKVIGVLSVVAVWYTFAFSNVVGSGYYFGEGEAAGPNGNEWQCPDSVAYNKELPRATFYYFADTESARRVLPESSEYWMSLDGTWKFHWVPEPSQRVVEFYKPDYDVADWDNIEVPSNWSIAGLQKDGSQRYGKPIYVNQKVIFQHQVKEDDWRGGVMRTPPEDWTTYNFRNEVGAYRRSFTVPESWKGRVVYINFDGVDSFFYLWINGRYVGFSKNSRNAARFDITKYLRKGENTVAVEVYRNSDGSFLEAQDMFRLPGIFRSVSLYSTSPLQVRDLVVIPDLTDDYTNGELQITASIRNLTDKNLEDCRMYYSLYANKLYSDENERVSGVEVVSAPVSISSGAEANVRTNLRIQNPNKWSAEAPWRYTLVGELKDKKGRVVETVSAYIGFRKVEIRDTPAEADEFGKAGRYFYVNGKPIKLKGVNRHETDPSTGHFISRERMEQEVMMMKRANINHVRNSHYPDAPYWYYLTDKYGIYLEDEANLESHEYYYGKASLSHVPEWENAHVDRVMELVHSRVNSPSVVIWSLGNEAGPGKNFETAYRAIKEFDVSRQVQYERNNDIVDIGSNQYPTVEWTQEAATGEMDDIKYPFHISEYAHSMGNAVGNLVDFWEAIESSNFLMGGAIWDWMDQSLYNYDEKTGVRYLAFGGDFGDYPTDGQFVMNGILFGDMKPKPQYYEVKKVYQNVAVLPVDMTQGRIKIFNKNYFESLSDYSVSWELLRNGVPVQKGIGLSSDVNLGPRESGEYVIPYDVSQLEPEAEYFVNVSFNLDTDKPWASAGYAQMAEQLPVKEGKRYSIKTIGGANPECIQTDSLIYVTGDGFKVTFNRLTGALCGLSYEGKDIIPVGTELALDAFRAYMNNDEWVYQDWFANGLYNLKHTATSSDISTTPDGKAVISFTVESQAPKGGEMKGGNGNSKGIYSIDEGGQTPFGSDDFKFITSQTWTVYPDGSIELNSMIDSNKPELVLPRLGYSVAVPSEFENYTYYGRGPEENYNDRKTGQFIGYYSSKVTDQYTEYTRPQSNGNREEVRWAAVTDSVGDGVVVIAPDVMSATYIPYSEMELFDANHPYKLKDDGRNILHLDVGVTGLGGASCGQDGPLAQDRVLAGRHPFNLIIRPLKASSLLL